MSISDNTKQDMYNTKVGEAIAKYIGKPYTAENMENFNREMARLGIEHYDIEPSLTANNNGDNKMNLYTSNGYWISPDNSSASNTVVWTTTTTGNPMDNVYNQYYYTGYTNIEDVFPFKFKNAYDQAAHTIYMNDVYPHSYHGFETDEFLRNILEILEDTFNYTGDYQAFFDQLQRSLHDLLLNYIMNHDNCVSCKVVQKIGKDTIIEIVIKSKTGTEGLIPGMNGKVKINLSNIYRSVENYFINKLTKLIEMEEGLND